MRIEVLIVHLAVLSIAILLLLVNENKDLGAAHFAHIGSKGYDHCILDPLLVECFLELPNQGPLLRDVIHTVLLLVVDCLEDKGLVGDRDENFPPVERSLQQISLLLEKYASLNTYGCLNFLTDLSIESILRNHPWRYIQHLVNKRLHLDFGQVAGRVVVIIVAVEARRVRLVPGACGCGERRLNTGPHLVQ